VTATELLEQAHAQGLLLKACGETLSISGPPAAVTALLPALKTEKAGLLALLRAGPPGSIVRTEDAPYRCHACWHYFPEAQLTVVEEALGCGFRCPRCRC
jgi:hypothetical protein